MARLGVWAIGQPRYLWDAGDTWLRVFDEERVQRLQPYREWASAGVAFAISTDAPVASYRPVETLETAVRRRTISGAVVGASQALTIEEAISAYTIDAARSFFVDDLVGSLKPGKLADIVVLDANPLTTSPDELGTIAVALTIVGGKIVFDPHGLGGLEREKGIEPATFSLEGHRV
jgi:predicted amidohydrolase YtcJ